VRGETADAELLLALAGPAARRFLDGEPHEDDYWLRVWGARGLLWAWDERALPEIRAALRDGAWRVREMALKAVAHHVVEGLAAEVAPLRADPNQRVRAAAERALVRLTSAPA
jgi:HEAT repeat protein